MRKNAFLMTLIALSLVLIGCSVNKDSYLDNQGETNSSTPRLIVRGRVCNEQGEGLPGVYVRMIEFLLANGDTVVLVELDAPSYNYAYTDANGNYTFVRYRGREMPKEVHVVATDTAGVYQTAARWTEVVYDYVNTYYGKQAFNGYVYADFVLKINE